MVVGLVGILVLGVVCFKVWIDFRVEHVSALIANVICLITITVVDGLRMGLVVREWVLVGEIVLWLLLMHLIVGD